MGQFGVMGKLLIGLGVFMVVMGILVLGADRIPFLGKLPGDIRIERDGVRVYFPLMTCILISLLATLVLGFFARR